MKTFLILIGLTAFGLGGGGVIEAPTEPIIIPDTTDECGCPQN